MYLLTFNNVIVSQLIFAHDTSRVIQALMKYGTLEHKTAVFEELRGNIVKMFKTNFQCFSRQWIIVEISEVCCETLVSEHIIEMMKTRYAKFFVRKLLKYG